MEGNEEDNDDDDDDEPVFRLYHSVGGSLDGGERLLKAVGMSAVHKAFVLQI